MKAYPVTILCRVMRVSRSGFYDYLNRFDRGTDDKPEESALTTRVHAIFKEHRSKYGSRRIVKQLKEEGYNVGRYKIRRIMRDLGLKAKISKRYKVTTDSRHSFPVAPNVLNRNFDVAAPNKVWTADISYVYDDAGRLRAGAPLPARARASRRDPGGARTAAIRGGEARVSASRLDARPEP